MLGLLPGNPMAGPGFAVRTGLWIGARHGFPQMPPKQIHRAPSQKKRKTFTGADIVRAKAYVAVFPTSAHQAQYPVNSINTAPVSPNISRPARLIGPAHRPSTLPKPDRRPTAKAATALNVIATPISIVPAMATPISVAPARDGKGHQEYGQRAGDQPCRYSEARAA
jgi:hypothetical protein